MLIRRELPSDIDAIGAVHASAFATDDGTQPVEVGLVTQLRTDSSWIPELSVVAQIDGVVVGHVCLTRATVGIYPVLALGPIGVDRALHATGVGTALMHAALGAADALNEPLVGLLGHLDYYPRFGFVPAATVGIVPSEPEWQSHFQIRTLTAYRPEIAGEFRYSRPFHEL